MQEDREAQKLKRIRGRIEDELRKDSSGMRHVAAFATYSCCLKRADSAMYHRIIPSQGGNTLEENSVLSNSCPMSVLCLRSGLGRAISLKQSSHFQLNVRHVDHLGLCSLQLTAGLLVSCRIPETPCSC